MVCTGADRKVEAEHSGEDAFSDVQDGVFGRICDPPCAFGCGFGASGLTRAEGLS
jgi:hypothetical protein